MPWDVSPGFDGQFHKNWQKPSSNTHEILGQNNQSKTFIESLGCLYLITVRWITRYNNWLQFISDRALQIKSSKKSIFTFFRTQSWCTFNKRPDLLFRADAEAYLRPMHKSPFIGAPALCIFVWGQNYTVALVDTLLNKYFSILETKFYTNT